MVMVLTARSAINRNMSLIVNRLSTFMCKKLMYMFNIAERCILKK